MKVFNVNRFFMCELKLKPYSYLYFKNPFECVRSIRFEKYYMFTQKK